MIKTLTCIECPKGCRLTLETDGSHVLAVSGQRCTKGEQYGRQEFENPMRVLTTTVLTEGLALRLVPVKTSAPIPKARLAEAMTLIRALRLRQPLRMGEAVVSPLGDLGVDLIATRTVTR